MKYLNSYEPLATFGRKLLEKPVLDEGIMLISKYTKEVIEVERSSIFIYNKRENLLWTILADESQKIIISAEEGVVGDCIKQQEAIVVNDAYSDERFCSDIDSDSGYVTKNLAVVPIFSPSGMLVGALELLNKKGGFDKEDLDFMKFFCGYISGYIGLALLFNKDKKALEKDHYLLS